MIKLEIPMKLPSLNEHIKACNNNRFNGANLKKNIEKDLALFINKLPKFKNPVRIHFIWVEANKKRDLDNICFAKKYILDAMVKCGKLENDNRKHVIGFTDDFMYADENKVILEIEEIENGL